MSNTAIKKILKYKRNGLTVSNTRLVTRIFEYSDLDTVVNFGSTNRVLREIYHTLSFPFVYRYMKAQKWSKQRVLDAYIKYFVYLPDQGTEQWLKQRIGTIGGSEMSTILGENQYQNLKHFVGSKLGIDEYRFSGSEATRWGKMLEDMFTRCVELLLNTKISVTGSVPGYRDEARGITLTSYSPDGLGLVPLSRIKQHIDRNTRTFGLPKASDDPRFKTMAKNAIREYKRTKNPEAKKINVLFEFKCPFRAKVSGSTPGHYLPQPMAGLVTIPIVEMALFMQGIFRKCKRKEFENDTRYDKIYHESWKPQDYEEPRYMGFIAFYDVNETFIEKRDLLDGYSPVESYGVREDDIEWMLQQRRERQTRNNNGQSAMEKLLSEENPDQNGFDPDQNSDQKGFDPTEPTSIEMPIDIQNEMIQELANTAKLEVRRPNSDYYAIEFSSTQAASIAFMLTDLIRVEPEYKQYDVPVSIENRILWEIFELLTNKSGNALKKIFISACELRRRQMFQNRCDFTKLNIGMDFGNSNMDFGKSEFDKFIEIAIDGRNNGLNVYYPDGVYHSQEDDDIYFSQDVPGNYVDMRLPKHAKSGITQPQKWLFQNLCTFEDYCRKHNYKPVGYMPWKMFEITCIPLYRDPNYIRDRLSYIETAHNHVESIRATTDAENYKRELDRHFPTHIRQGTATRYTANSRYKHGNNSRNTHTSNQTLKPTNSAPAIAFTSVSVDHDPTQPGTGEYTDMDDFYDDIC